MPLNAGRPPSQAREAKILGEAPRERCQARCKRAGLGWLLATLFHSIFFWDQSSRLQRVELSRTDNQLPDRFRPKNPTHANQ